MKRHTWILVVLCVFLLAGGVISSGKTPVTWRSINRSFHLPATVFSPQNVASTTVKIASEESVVTSVVERVSPSVVTIGMSTSAKRMNTLFGNPFDPFGGFDSRQNGKSDTIEQDIGSGFIISKDGLIVTNKHVVSDTQATYRVITNDNKSYDVVKLYRDADNDLAIIKINASGLTPLEMGDSSKIKVGQTAIAIGTALGEFRNTVTVGVISGVGRGITAGGSFGGNAEKLNNVIQTDAAINPGNSGGPLLNSEGQVIGVNSAIASDGQNIGFALPINVVKDAVSNFNATGQFNRPFLGIEYRMISRQIALLNDVPEGAFVARVVSDSPAEKAGVQDGDIIVKINGEKLTDENDVAHVISGKKVGDSITLSIWRDGKDVSLSVVLVQQK